MKPQGNPVAGVKTEAKKSEKMLDKATELW